MTGRGSAQGWRQLSVLSNTGKTLVTKAELCDTAQIVVRKEILSDDPFWQEALRHEARVIALLNRNQKLQAVTPRLISNSYSDMTLSFIDGSPLADVKYPRVDMSPWFTEVNGLANDIASQELGAEIPRLDPSTRIEFGKYHGVMRKFDTDLLYEKVRSAEWTFCHGDFLPRNLIGSHGTVPMLCAVDWELASYAPTGYDLAVFWSSLFFSPEARHTFSERFLTPEHAPALLLVALRELRTSTEAAGSWHDAAAVVPSLEAVAALAARTALMPQVEAHTFVDDLERAVTVHLN